MVSTTDTGRQAETAVATYLGGHGFQVIDRNWRNRWCEIDIIAMKAGVVYFVEVKYRSTETWGAGLDYITAAKIKRMTRGADMWANRHGCQDYTLAAAAVSGHRFVVTDFIVLN